jgi:hypothetical protein
MKARTHVVVGAVALVASLGVVVTLSSPASAQAQAPYSENTIPVGPVIPSVPPPQQAAVVTTVTASATTAPTTTAATTVAPVSVAGVQITAATVAAPAVAPVKVAGIQAERPVAFTGANSGSMVIAGAGFVAAGSLLLVGARRRSAARSAARAAP